MSVINLVTRMRKAELLEALKRNRTAHAAEVAEAKVTYLQKATAKLRERLVFIEAGTARWS